MNCPGSAICIQALSLMVNEPGGRQSRCGVTPPRTRLKYLNGEIIAESESSDYNINFYTVWEYFW